MNKIGWNKKNFQRQFVHVPGIITVFQYDKIIKLEYISSKQDSHQCIILSLSGEYITPKDYRIRFMDTQGNPLDKDIRSDLDYIKADISYNYRGVINIIHLDTLTNNFYEKMMHIMVSTALKRKTDLLDFFDPQVWKDSEKEVPVDKMQVLNEVREKRMAEEDERSKYINIEDIPYSSTKEVEKLMEYRKLNITKI